MKTNLGKFTVFGLLFLAVIAIAQSNGGKSSRKGGYHSGHYQNGSGSSHKGGHYKNSSTNNHYRKRK